MNGAFWVWALEKAWKIDRKVLQKKEFDRSGTEWENRGDRMTTLAKQF